MFLTSSLSRIKVAFRRGVFFFFFVMGLTLVSAGCGPLNLTFTASNCLNVPLDECQRSGDALSLSKAADLRVYELSSRVDVNLLSYDALIQEKASQLSPVMLNHVDLTLLPGETRLYELSPVDKTRYLLFFLTGRERAGDRTWLKLVRVPRIRRQLQVRIEGYSIQVVRRRHP